MRVTVGSEVRLLCHPVPTLSNRLGEGLRKLPSFVCCSEHSRWHLMNCDGFTGMLPIVDAEFMRQGGYDADGIVNETFF